MAKPAKVIILGDASDAAKAFKQIRDEAAKSESKLKKVGDGMARVGTGLSIGLTVPLVALGKASVDAARESQEANARLESSFDSMGAASFTSLEKLREQADRLGNDITAVGDEAVLETQARMLTFGNITGEVFDRAIVTAVDLAEKMGTDAADAALQLGKAINDPVRGMTQLTRVGITFSDAQREQVKEMVAAGDTMAAQTFILEELEREFGGTAEAMAKTDAGKLRQSMNELGESAEAVGAVILPVFADLAGKVTDVAGAFSDLDPATQKLIVGIGGAVAAVGPLLIVAGKLVTAVDTLKNSSFSLSKVMGSPLTGPLVIATGLAVGFAAVLQRNKSRTDAWREALEGGEGALEEFSDELIATEIVNRDLIGSMEEAGITADDVKEAILGDKDAFQEFVGKLGPGQADLMEWVEAQRIAREKADEHKRAIDEQKGSLENLSNKIPVFGGAMAGYTQATGDAADETDRLDGNTQNLADTQRALVDPLFNLTQANEDLNEAQRAYNDALVEHGPKSAEARDAGIELGKAQLEANSATQRYAEEGGPAAVEVLKETLAAAGLTEEMIRAIIQSIKDLNATEVTNPIVRGGGGGAAAFDSGGVIPGRRGEPKMILAHAGETVLPTHRKDPAKAFADQFGVPSPAAAVGSFSGGGGMVVQVSFPNYLGSKQEVAQIIRDELVKIGRRNATAGVA